MASFVTETIASEIRSQFGSPVFIYDENSLLKQVSSALRFPVNGDGLTVRYAMKACPNAAILQVEDSLFLLFSSN
jgi:diaminopimelate decarboxylase